MSDPNDNKPKIEVELTPSSGAPGEYPPLPSLLTTDPRAAKKRRTNNKGAASPKVTKTSSRTYSRAPQDPEVILAIIAKLLDSCSADLRNEIAQQFDVEPRLLHMVGTVVMVLAEVAYSHFARVGRRCRSRLSRSFAASALTLPPFPAETSCRESSRSGWTSRQAK